MSDFKSNSGEQFKIPDLAFNIKFGGIGTIVGFLMAPVGSFLLDGQGFFRPTQKAVISYYQETESKREKTQVPL
jgi:hypothetical protein